MFIFKNTTFVSKIQLLTLKNTVFELQRLAGLSLNSQKSQYIMVSSPSLTWQAIDCCMKTRAATSSRMLECPHCWQLLEYDFSYPSIQPQKKEKEKISSHLALSRPTLTRARESSGRWHGTVGKNVSQLEHCQTHHSETGTKCPDSCLDSEENGLFCHLCFLKQHCLLLLLLLNRRLQLQLEVILHAFSATDLGYCSSGMVVVKKKL